MLKKSIATLCLVSSLTNIAICSDTKKPEKLDFFRKLQQFDEYFSEIFGKRTIYRIIRPHPKGVSYICDGFASFFNQEQIVFEARKLICIHRICRFRKFKEPEAIYYALERLWLQQEYNKLELICDEEENKR